MAGFRMTRMFFDRKAVTSRVDKATRRVLSKFGAFVRTTARRSIRPRKRKAPSPPGQPPTSRIGLLKRFIFFGYDPQKRSVVIGPERLNQKGRGEAPRLLEHGGIGTVVDRTGQRVKGKYRPRPFMGPAFAKEQPKLPQMWRDSVR